MISLSTYAAAIVDLDGTMVNTMGDFDAAINRMLLDLSIPPLTVAQIEPMVGKGSENLIRTALLASISGGNSLQSIDNLYLTAWQSYQRHYAAINGQFSDVYPGVVEGLSALQLRGLRLACLTNKPLGFAKALIQAKSLAQYFSHIYGGDSFEQKKPHPLPVLKTCQALGCPPARTLMIGDSSNDAMAARAAGCPILLVSYGYNHGEPIALVEADAIVDSLAQLVTMSA